MRCNLHRIDCEYADINGNCKSPTCERPLMPSDEWNTGDPPYDGQYLVYCGEDMGIHVDEFNCGGWECYGYGNVKAWKKIYVPLWLLEEKEDGR